MAKAARALARALALVGVLVLVGIALSPRADVFAMAAQAQSKAQAQALSPHPPIPEQPFKIPPRVKVFTVCFVCFPFSWLRTASTISVLGDYPKIDFLWCAPLALVSLWHEEGFRVRVP